MYCRILNLSNENCTGEDDGSGDNSEGQSDMNEGNDAEGDGETSSDADLDDVNSSIPTVVEARYMVVFAA